MGNSVMNYGRYPEGRPATIGIGFGIYKLE
jgi:hypothetical protein